jgi:hypothetical protein
MAFDPRQLYELHITVNIREHDLAEVVAKELHWKMSQIMGDPVLGHKQRRHRLRAGQARSLRDRLA